MTPNTQPSGLARSVSMLVAQTPKRHRGPARNPWGLTVREEDALRAICLWGNYKLAARALNVAYKTIEKHSQRAAHKMPQQFPLLRYLAFAEWDRSRQQASASAQLSKRPTSTTAKRERLTADAPQPALPPLPELPEPAHHVRVGDGKYRNAWSAAQIQILLRDYGAKCHAAGVAAEREHCAMLCEEDPYEVGAALAAILRAQRSR